MKLALERLPHLSSRGVATVAVALLVATSSVWMFRAAGIYHMQRLAAFHVRTDWAYMPDTAGDDPAAPVRLERNLRNDALDLPGPNPYLRPRWMDRWWGE